MNIPIIRVEVLLREAEKRLSDSKLVYPKTSKWPVYCEGRRDALRDLLREARKKQKEKRA